MLITYVAINGHSTLMLFSAAALFSELNAFEASTSKAALVSSASKAFAYYSSNHLAHADWANLAIAFVKRNKATG